MSHTPRLHRDDDGRLPAKAWPGGYQIVYYTKDMGLLCPDCANGLNGSDASESSDDPQWKLVDSEVYWEGPAMPCEHCNALIESAYGDPDEAQS